MSDTTSKLGNLGELNENINSLDILSLNYYRKID